MKKRALSLFLAVLLLTACLAPGVQAVDTYSGTLKSVFDPVISATRQTDAAHAIGVDVSYAQGKIDWDTAAQYIDFAIIRCGYGTDSTFRDDRQWLANVEACTRLGIPFGVYLYSYAQCAEAAASEAAHVLRLLEGYSPALPVFYDLEDPETVAKVSSDVLLEMTATFCNLIAQAGYTPGIYASASWWNDTARLNREEYSQYPCWVAHWNTASPYILRDYQFWQYSCTGQVPGINADVDLNYGNISGITTGKTPKKTGISAANGIHTHSPMETHLVLPTCTAGGYTKWTCACGQEFTDSYTDARGHTYISGVCLNCGKAISDLTGKADNSALNKLTDLPAKDNWAYPGISYCITHGLMQGVNETRFLPKGVINRAQFITILHRLADSPQVYSTGAFTDVEEDDWYAEPAQWAYNSGVSRGIDGAFAPKNEINREQAAVFLYRLYGGGTPTVTLNRFTDSNKVSEYALDAMAWAVEEGFLQGTDEGQLLPKASLTRAQAASILMRLLTATAK